MKYISHEENKTGLYLTVSYRRWYWPFGIVTRTVFSKRHAPWNNWFDLDTGKRFGDDPKLTAIWNAACQREAKLLHEIEELDKQIAAEEKKAAAKFDLPKKPAAPEPKSVQVQKASGRFVCRVCNLPTQENGELRVQGIHG